MTINELMAECLLHLDGAGCGVSNLNHDDGRPFRYLTVSKLCDPNQGLREIQAWLRVAIAHNMYLTVSVHYDPLRTHLQLGAAYAVDGVTRE